MERAASFCDMASELKLDTIVRHHFCQINLVKNLVYVFLINHNRKSLLYYISVTLYYIMV